MSLLLTMLAFLAPAPSCATVTPVLALNPPPIMAGNFRDTESNCYVWLNVRYRWWKSRVCNTVHHEIAHLNGAQHPIPRDKSCRSASNGRGRPWF